LDTFGWDGFHSLSFGEHLWVVNSEIPVEGAQRREPLISSARLVASRFFNHAQKIQHPFKREIHEREARYGPTTQTAHVDQKQLQSVAVAPDRTWTETLLDLEVVLEKGEYNLAEVAAHRLPPIGAKA
jgi:hypothetical protein